MGRPHTYHAQAVVLKAVPHGEADLIAIMLSAEHGKLRAAARGARKPNSKLVGHLEPFTLLDLTLATGQSMDTVAQAQALDSFMTLKSSLEATSRAQYIAELVDGFAVEASPNPLVYQLFLDTLAWLSAHPVDDLALRRFELLLLKHSGFAPELQECLECRTTIEAGKHRYSPSSGGLLCQSCTPSRSQVVPVSVQAVKVLRFLDRAELVEVDKLHVAPGLADELRSLLAATVRSMLERDVRSTAFLAHLARLAVGAGQKGWAG